MATPKNGPPMTDAMLEAGYNVVADGVPEAARDLDEGAKAILLAGMIYSAMVMAAPVSLRTAALNLK